MNDQGSKLVAHKILTFALCLCAGFSLVGWGFKLWPYAQASQPGLSDIPMPTADSSANLKSSQIASILGVELKSQQKAPDMALARLTLLGLIHRDLSNGVALISIDSQPPRPYRVDSPVGDTLVLSSVNDKGVGFRLNTSPKNAGDELRLELPKSTALSLSLSVTHK